MALQGQMLGAETEEGCVDITIPPPSLKDTASLPLPSSVSPIYPYALEFCSTHRNETCVPSSPWGI